MFNKKEEKINVIMDELLASNVRLADGMQTRDIEQIWRKLFGNTIAKYTTSIKIDNDKMIVKISSAALRNELVYDKEKLLRKINEALNFRKIVELIIR